MLILLDRPTLLKIFTRADRKDVYDKIQRLYLELEEQFTIDDNVTDTDIKHLLTMLGYYLEKHNDETDVLGITIGKTVKCILKNVDCFLPENTPEQRNVTINILRSILYHARRYDRAVATYKRKQVRIINEKYDMNLNRDFSKIDDKDKVYKILKDNLDLNSSTIGIDDYMDAIYIDNHNNILEKLKYIAVHTLSTDFAGWTNSEIDQVCDIYRKYVEQYLRENV